MKQRNKAVKANGRPDSLTYDPVRLKRRRFAAGLTQVEAARIAGCTPSHICRLEHGVHGVSPTMLAALAGAYECEIADLMPPEPEGAAA